MLNFGDVSNTRGVQKGRLGFCGWLAFSHYRFVIDSYWYILLTVALCSGTVIEGG